MEAYKRWVVPWAHYCFNLYEFPSITVNLWIALTVCGTLLVSCVYAILYVCVCDVALREGRTTVANCSEVKFINQINIGQSNLFVMIR